MEGKEELNFIQSNISVYDFNDFIMGTNIFFHTIKMCNSFHVCIGTEAVMKNMAVAMPTKYDKGAPSGSILFGDRSDFVSLSMAQKFAKCTGKQVFVSCSVPYDQNLIPLIEKRLGEEMKHKPEKF